MKKTNYSLVNSRTQEKVVDNLWIADNFFSRFLGLIGSNALQNKEGLLISPCQQIHTHFMGYSVDVIFLDRQHRVLHTVINMKPWKMTKYVKNAYYVLEIAEKCGQNIKVGDTLTLHQS